MHSYINRQSNQISILIETSMMQIHIFGRQGGRERRTVGVSHSFSAISTYISHANLVFPLFVKN